MISIDMLILRNPHLAAFESICELGTTHAAARQLRLTQTAVTQRIKTLERELGLTLFLRSRRGMRPTAEALTLLQFCKATRELEGQYQSRVAGSSRSEISLTLAGPTSAISSRVAENALPLYEKFPFLRLHLQSDDSGDLVEKLRRGEIDLAVVHPDLVPNEMDSKLLRPDRYLLVCSPKWKGRKIQDILEQERVIDFHEGDRTTMRYLTLFGWGKMARKGQLFVNENEALVKLFAAGVGYGTLTESIAKPYLDSGKIIALNKGQAMEDPLAVIWYPRSEKSPHFEELVRALR